MSGFDDGPAAAAGTAAGGGGGGADALPEFTPEGRKSFSATAELGIKRVMTFAFWPPRLVVHIIGGEPWREGVDATWEPLAAAISHRGCKTMRIVVVGPSMRDRPAVAVGIAEVVHVRALYDEWVATAAATEEPPEVALMFHPGLWGYATWRPTLRALFSRGIPLVVTSYTPQEADLDTIAVGAAFLAEAEADDEDKAAKAAESQARWIWRPAKNPHASAELRPTKTAPEGHEYRENHAWFAVIPR